MKRVALLLSTLLSTAALGQAGVQQAGPNEPGYSVPGAGPTREKPKLNEAGRSFVGQITDLDKTAGIVTLKHQSIGMLGVPAGTVEYTAKDKAVLQNMKIGDRVLFNAVLQGRSLQVTNVAPY